MKMITIEFRRSLLVTLAVAMLLLVTPAGAHDGHDEDIENFRNDLLAYVSQIEQLPSGVLEQMGGDRQYLGDSDEVIRRMTHDELHVMKEQMDLVPFWRQLPTLISLQVKTSNPSPADLVSALPSMTGLDSQAGIRKQFENLIEVFRGIPAEQFSPGYQQRVDQLESMIMGASDREILMLGEDLDENMARWNQQLETARNGGGKSVPALGVEAHCGTSFPSSVWCVMGHIFTDIANFFTALPGHALNALNSIKGIFTDLAGAFASSVSGLLSQAINALDLSSIDWAAVAAAADQYARLPCPPNGFILPGFGEVGEIRTATNYNGTVGFAGNAIADIMPSDVLTSANIQAIAAVANFPVQWLGSCLQAAYDDNFDTMQSNHRDLVAKNLDVKASTRATQTSLDFSQAQTNDIDGDVAVVEAKLDRLGVTTLRHDAKSTDLELKIDNLKLQQGQTNDQLDDTQAIVLRMFIEQDLLRNGNDKIGLFQMPAAQGGNLETARDIVAETIASRSAAGVSTKQAERDFASALEQHSFGNYKAAYDLFRRAYQKAVN